MLVMPLAEDTADAPPAAAAQEVRGVVAPAWDDDVVRPFRVASPISALAGLMEQVSRPWPHAAPRPGEPGDFERIAEQAAVDAVLTYWQYGYDWRANRARLNAAPQFATTIDGTGIHLFHARSPEPDAVPLLLTHAQPGSSLEFLRRLGPLSDPRAFGLDPARAFHVVAPAAPGAPLSGRAPGGSWSAARTAAAWDLLMRRLGYAEYECGGEEPGGAVACRRREPNGECGERGRRAPAAPPVDTDTALTAMTLAWLARVG